MEWPTILSKMIKSREFRLKAVLSWLAGVVALTTALAIPFGFFQTVYQHEVSRIQSIAELAADHVSEYVTINSSTWRFQVPRLTEILAKIGHGGKWGQQRLLDLDGREILSVGREVITPAVSSTAKVYDGEKSVALVEITESLQPTILDTSIAALVGAILGISIYTVLRLVPMRALRQIMGNLEHSYEDLAKEIKAKEKALQRAKDLGETMRRLAQHDTLTGLPNRLMFTERLKQALNKARRHSSQLALFFIDLDQFKHVNDSLGHSVGDQLLQKVAQRLKQNVRGEDTVARLAGDEFTVIMEDLHRPQEAAVVAQKLMASFKPTFRIKENELFMSVSIGISLYPQDGLDLESLIRNADTAMYRSKEEGRNNFQFYTKDMTARAVERARIETELRRALVQDQFELYYQPQVDLDLGRMQGAEALVRWRHTNEGLRLPFTFITVAEETGLIVPIGAWVLRAACTRIKAWHDAGCCPGRIAVNLAGKELMQESFVQTVLEIMDDTGCSPTFLELEVSESFFMGKAQQTLQILHQLRDLGITIAIDDFGTAYSSLSHLKRLPITKLKIDRSFIGGIAKQTEDEDIAKAIIAMAKSLQLEVVAEGVETAEQRQFLRTVGCNTMQGNLVSQPLPVSEFEHVFLMQTMSPKNHTQQVVA
jgi:diguanylate cyclase (GGDEF)-like protein